MALADNLEDKYKPEEHLKHQAVGWQLPFRACLMMERENIVRYGLD